MLGLRLDRGMPALFEKFGVEPLPRNERRARLVEDAFAGGLILERELETRARALRVSFPAPGAPAIGPWVP
jgi:hypothetical protein